MVGRYFGKEYTKVTRTFITGITEVVTRFTVIIPREAKCFYFLSTEVHFIIMEN